ncbi:MAG TPA: SRPBCC family protein [Frankiaceae bacterium]|nr:SRPBCC family protein [Frankiaceae bacterium]
MTFDPGPLADVAMTRDGERWTLELARELRFAPDRVWAVLTDPARLREWAPYTADRDLGSTGDVTLTMLDGQSADLPATVRRADAPKVLEYTWGGDQLRWQLDPAGAGTRLTLRHSVADRGTGLDVAAGWHLCLAVAERLLDGDPVGPIVGAAALDHGWTELRDAYEARLA